MLSGVTVITIFCLYMGGLFLLALWTSRQRAAGKSLVGNPLIYSLSLAVYCSSWTFYGSVGLAAGSGFLFLTIYLGPTLACLFLPHLAGKIIRLKSSLHITSIADFISARYEKSEPLAALVTLMAIVGITPYVALQLKAVFASFAVITASQDNAMFLGWVGAHVGPVVVVMMIIFTIIFGVRRLDPTERHEGMVVAVAAESVVKLIAFLAVGVFVVYVAHDGLEDIFSRATGARDDGQLALGPPQSPGLMTWISYLLLAANAFLFLPRQFHIAMVEAKGSDGLRWAMWLFPLYLFAINLFVFPVAQAGLLHGYSLEQADTFVLLLPLYYQSPGLALLVFIGGFSAATSMIMISSMTMSTMIANHLLLPLVDWVPQLAFMERLLLRARWITVAGFICLGYAFERLVGEQYPLAGMGMLSFAATLQFTPAIIGGLYWSRGHRIGALLGLWAGFSIWLYTLLLPSLSSSGYVPTHLMSQGPLGLSWLRPQALFGLEGLDPISHTVFWSMLFNVGFYISGSLWANTRDSRVQGDAFVQTWGEPDLYRPPSLKAEIGLAVKSAKVEGILLRYFDRAEAGGMIERALSATGLGGRSLISVSELAEFVDQVERFLAGAIGTATAHRVMAQAELFSESESETLRQIYAEMLAEFRARPQDLKRKIDYYRERESLIQRHADELEEKVKALQAEIAKRRQAEGQLRESEERYRMAIEESNDAVAVLRDDRMIFINRKLPEIFGYPRRRDLVNQSMLALVHPDDETRVQKLNQERKEMMPAPFRFDFKGLKMDGSSLYIAVSASAHKYRDEVLDLVFMRDVTARRKAEEDIRRLSRRLIEGIEEERRRLAADLHDEFGQALTGLHLRVESMHNSFDPDLAAYRLECQEIIGRIEGIADSVRSIATELRPDVLDHLGLVATMEWYLNEYRERAKGLDIEFNAMGFAQRIIQPQAEIALYRILQEALNNVLKHARASRVTVQLTYSHPLIILVIRDNGKGFTTTRVSALEHRGGIGLISMRERVAAAGGALDIQSSPGKGTRIRVRLPNKPVQ